MWMYLHVVFVSIKFNYNISLRIWRTSILRVKIENTFIFRFHRRPIQLLLFVPVGLSSSLRHLMQVLLGVEVSSVARPGQLTVGVQITDPVSVEDVKTTKDPQE